MMNIVANGAITGIKLAGSYGAGTIVGCAVNKVMPASMNVVQKTCVVVAGTCLSGVAANVVSNYVDEQVKLVKKLHSITKEQKAMKKTRRDCETVIDALEMQNVIDELKDELEKKELNEEEA